MKLFILSLLLFFSNSLLSQVYSKVKVFANEYEFTELVNLGLPVDHGDRKKNTFIITDLSELDIATLDDNNYRYEIIIADVKKYYRDHSNDPYLNPKNVNCTTGGTNELPEVPVNFYQNNSYAGFYKYQDMLDALDDMANLYPSLISVKQPISNFLTHEGLPIYHVVISDNPSIDEATEPNVLYTAIHHAREPMSMSQTIFYMWYLLENYSSNDEVKFLVDNNQLFFVPCINPDGYRHNESTDPSGFGMHRKNKNPAIGSTNPGVDLNRNYSYGWNTTGVSPNVNNDTYPGVSAFSEPETQAIKWLVESRNFISALNAHSYGELLLYPVGTTVSEFADHNDYFVDLSDHMVEENGYFAQKSSGLYPASGDSDDYMYKDNIGVGQKDTIFAMTPETGTDFWPASSQVVPTCQAMVSTNLILAHMTHKYLVVKDSDGSSYPTITGDFNHSALRLGLIDGPVTVSIESLEGIQSVGSDVIYNLNLRETTTGSIAYVLNPSIQFGDPVVYVLNTDYGDWIYRDTISKTYGALTVQVVDNGNTTTNWTGSWSVTSDDSYSPSTSFTESNGGNYANNSDKSFEYANTIDLTNATGAMVSFYAKWNIEANYDYCQFQVSTNNGATWIGQCGNFTVPGVSGSGSVQPSGKPVWEGVSDWVLEEINLSDYLGQSIKVRFRFESDGGVTEDGFYFDDFQISFSENDASVEETKGTFVKVFPNPAKNDLQISLSNYVNEGTLKVYNEIGEIVLLQEINSSVNLLKIDVSKLSNGMYFIQLENNELESLPTKFAILN